MVPCITARYECQACDVDSAPLQWMLALPAERPNTRIGPLELAKPEQQGLAVCKTLGIPSIQT